jgi:hypothetical protein
MKNLIFVFSLLGALRVSAAMVRVVEVRDGRTLVVQNGASTEVVSLAGVELVDGARAADLLRWNVGSSWVLVEARPEGGAFVWRSPDALFLNRELVERGYARATQHGVEREPNVIVTYLGEVDPAGPPRLSGQPPKTSSGTSRRSSVPRSRKTRVPAATKSAAPAHQPPRSSKPGA